MLAGITGQTDEQEPSGCCFVRWPARFGKCFRARTGRRRHCRGGACYRYRLEYDHSGGGVDINLIPFPMIDHVDILKDGASAVYGSDAIAGVVNFFLIHKFRGLEIGGSYGNTNLGASNEMGEWEAWIKAGTGDDKTDIVVVADFWERTGGLLSRDRDISANGFFVPFGGFDARSGNFPGRVQSGRLLPSLFFAD